MTAPQDGAAEPDLAAASGHVGPQDLLAAQDVAAPQGMPGRPIPAGPPASDAAEQVFDPLKLCIFTTIALLAWVLGPFAVLAFAVLGLAGYVRAHRAGLRRSRCYLRDVRIVLAYLGLVGVAAAVFAGLRVASWLG